MIRKSFVGEEFKGFDIVDMKKYINDFIRERNFYANKYLKQIKQRMMNESDKNIKETIEEFKFLICAKLVDEKKK